MLEVATHKDYIYPCNDTVFDGQCEIIQGIKINKLFSKDVSFFSWMRRT